jgi:hypothetical protein
MKGKCEICKQPSFTIVRMWIDPILGKIHYALSCENCGAPHVYTMNIPNGDTQKEWDLIFMED